MKGKFYEGLPTEWQNNYSEIKMIQTKNGEDWVMGRSVESNRYVRVPKAGGVIEKAVEEAYGFKPQNWTEENYCANPDLWEERIENGRLKTEFYGQPSSSEAVEELRDQLEVLKAETQLLTSAIAEIRQAVSASTEILGKAQEELSAAQEENRAYLKWLGELTGQEPDEIQQLAKKGAMSPPVVKEKKTESQHKKLNEEYEHKLAQLPLGDDEIDVIYANAEEGIEKSRTEVELKAKNAPSKEKGDEIRNQAVKKKRLEAVRAYLRSDLAEARRLDLGKEAENTILRLFEIKDELNEIEDAKDINLSTKKLSTVALDGLRGLISRRRKEKSEEEKSKKTRTVEVWEYWRGDSPESRKRRRVALGAGVLAVAGAALGLGIYAVAHKTGSTPADIREHLNQLNQQINILRGQNKADLIRDRMQHETIVQDQSAIATLRDHVNALSAQIRGLRHQLGNSGDHKYTTGTLGYYGDSVWHEVSRRLGQHVLDEKIHRATAYVLKLNHLRWNSGGPGVDAHKLPVGFSFRIPNNLAAIIHK